MNGNDDYLTAHDSKNSARLVGFSEDVQGEVLLREAQIEATLALAYEQRTANLIAFTGEYVGAHPNVDYRELLDTIATRLGLIDGD